MSHKLASRLDVVVPSATLAINAKINAKCPSSIIIAGLYREPAHQGQSFRPTATTCPRALRAGFFALSWWLNVRARPKQLCGVRLRPCQASQQFLPACARTRCKAVFQDQPHTLSHMAFQYRGRIRPSLHSKIKNRGKNPGTDGLNKTASVLQC